MASTIKKSSKKRQSRKSIRRSMSAKRKKAIEQAIQFWKSHALDLSHFKFDREEANAR